MRRPFGFAAGGLLFLAAAILHGVTIAAKMDLQPVSLRVGRLFPQSGETVKVIVRDERPADPWLVTGGHLGSGRRVIQGWYSDDPRQVASLFEAGARDALEVLGLKAGEGVSLEIAIKQFRVELVSPSFGAPNYIAWGRLQTTLRPPGGEPATREFGFASYETASGNEAIAAAFARPAWAAAARPLLAHLQKKPDPDSIGRLLVSLDANKDQRQREYAVFWLGLVGRDDPAVAEKLLALMRNDRNQSVFQQAAVSLAALGVPAGKEEVEAVLSGAKKLPKWDVKDDENAWHLLHALALSGEADLSSKVPAAKKSSERLADLIRFHQSGDIPKMAPADLEELNQKLAQKRKP